MTLTPETFVIKNDEVDARPITMADLAELHLAEAEGMGDPISKEAAWQYAVDEVNLGNYRVTDAPGRH
jgi:hypothetical protein